MNSEDLSSYLGSVLLYSLFLSDITENNFLNAITIFILGYISIISLNAEKNCDINKNKKEKNE